MTKSGPLRKEGWPLSFVRGSVLVAVLLAQDQWITEDVKPV